MLRNGLLLLHQFIAPMFKLCRDALNTADLLNASGFNLRGIIIAQPCVWHLHYRMGGMFVDLLAKCLQNTNGSAQFGCGGHLHNQAARRWAALKRRLIQCFSSRLNP